MKFKIGQVVADIGHEDHKPEKVHGYHYISGAAIQVYRDGYEVERYTVDGLLMTKKRINNHYENSYFEWQLRKLTAREAGRQ